MLHTARRGALRAALVWATLLGLAAIPLASTASATHPSPSCATVANPLGAATGYTEFIAGNGHRGSESEGAIAWGGNLDASGMTVGTRLSSAKDDATLVIAGTHGQWFNLQKGSAYVNPASGVNFNGQGHYLASNPIDFSAAFTDLRTKSTAWGTAATTGTVDLYNAPFAGQTLLRLTGSDAQLNIFNITPAQIAASNGFAIDVPQSATTIVNVSGTSIALNGQMWIKQGNSWHQASDGVMANFHGLLWNLPAATSIAMNFGSAWGGSILAPNATLDVNSVGHTIGQIITASFSSNFETHQNLFASNACLPGGGGGGPTPTADADVQVTKSASKANPSGGSTFRYALNARNNGPGQANGVVIHDTLPLGVTFDWASAGCSAAGVIVTCDLGDLNNGESKTVKIGVIANPIGSGGSLPHPGQQHNLTISKLESQVDLNAGETKTVALSCPGSGAILSDASVRVDAVDQGTGALTDVHVTAGRSTGAGSWEAVVTNGATGRAQAKAFAVCLPARTESAGGHQHALVAASALATTTQSWGVGRQTAAVPCPSGTTPIVPGFAFAGGAATVAGSEPTAGGWTFTVDVSAPTAATLSVRCLDADVDTAQGHTHALLTRHVVKTITVPAGQTIEEQVVCADDAKGIVGTWSLPAGVFSLGNDPRPKTRAFKLVNTTAAGQTATIDLECLNDRTGPEKVSGAAPVSVANTATVTTTSNDTGSPNNTSASTVTVQPGNVVALGASATAGASKLTVKAIASVDGNATITVTSPSGTVWAGGSANLAAGTANTVQLDLTSAGQSALGSSTKKGKGTIALSAGDGTRWMTIKPA